MDIKTDILISGGGIAGLVAAAAFGQAGFSVVCVDPAPPVTERDAEGADLRTTAFLQPSCDLLHRAGLWTRLALFAMPLQTMRIVDAAGTDPGGRVTRDFEAKDLSDLPFGWNLPNWLLRREISQALAEMDNVSFFPGTATERLFTRSEYARVGLSDGRKVTARLVIAADGRSSPMRQAAGIGVKTVRFGQKALAFAVTHPVPHEGVSTEIHRTGGPFTFVPLADLEGMPSSAIVWMEDGPRASNLAELDIPAFEAAMTERSGGVFGPLTLASRRTLWPIISQVADRLTSERLALVAEAAHVLPPIGAQGLNMSLADIATLLEMAQMDLNALGGKPMLDRYHNARIHDIRARVAGISLLNKVSQSSIAELQRVRSAGVELLHDARPLRRTVMQMGLGARSVRDVDV